MRGSRDTSHVWGAWRTDAVARPSRGSRPGHAISFGVLAAVAAVLLVPVASRALDVEVRGHESIGTGEIRRIVLGPEGEWTDPDRVAAGVDSLLARFVELGRPFARVSVSWDTAGGEVRVEVDVEEGPDVRTAEIGLLRRDGPAGSDGPGTMEPGRRIPLKRTALRREIDVVLDGYSDSGHPFASVALPASVPVEEGAARIELSVDPGPRVTFGEVLVSGNEQTRDHVIVRETGISPGSLYSAAAVSQVRSRLEKLPFLRSVSEPVVAVDPSTGEADVGVQVVEAASNRISGVFGFSGREGDEELTGLVDLTLGNIAGTGRRATVSWEQFRRNETEISFSYVEPWLLGAPVDVGVSGAQSVRDTLYTTTEADLFVTAGVGALTKLTWSLGAERFVPGADEDSPTTSTRMALSADYDARDAPANPAGGLRVLAGASYSAKEVTDTGEDESSGTFSLGVERYFAVTGAQVVAFIGRAALLTSTEDVVPFHELLTLGGARSLRGYREEQFRGTRTGLATAEYRFLLTRRSRALVFVDVGYWYREGPNPAKDTKLGYGIGLRGETRLGTISIDYGLGEGDGLLDGKLHAGLAREF